MTTEAHIVLTNSDDSLSKRFKVLVEGFGLLEERSDVVRKTVDGEVDVSSGHIYPRHEYIIKVRGEESDPDYGDLDDLRTFWGYNNPNGTPSKIITMTDHLGSEYLVVMLGSFARSPLTVVLDGPEAVYHVKCTLFVVGGGLS